MLHDSEKLDDNITVKIQESIRVSHTQKSESRGGILNRGNSISNNKTKTENLGQNSLKAQYFTALRNILERNKHYPVMAKRLGHKGNVQVEFQLNRQGSLIEITTLEGEFETLKKAVKDLLESSSFPKAPVELKESVFDIKVEISFN